MTLSDIFTICVSAVIVITAMRAAYCIGHRVGYWKRVDQEKASRGIR